jgi:tetrapyrrole methylase family protein / MazG family protein
MQQIDQLITILETLLGPDGCPWDQKQTLASIKEDLMEEACEVLDAIDSKDPEAIQEELGDLFFVVLFLCKLAEKENMGQLSDIVQQISDKIVRRHPHIFDKKADLTDEELKEQWDEIKKLEKKTPRHPLERIPKSLPALAKAMELIDAAKKHEWEIPETKLVAKPETNPSDPELEIGNAFFELAKEAYKKGINPELALRRALADHEKALCQKYSPFP